MASVGVYLVLFPLIFLSLHECDESFHKKHNEWVNKCRVIGKQSRRLRGIGRDRISFGEREADAAQPFTSRSATSSGQSGQEFKDRDGPQTTGLE